MPHEEIDGVPIWFEEHGDPDGPPLVAVHGGIMTFGGSLGDVLLWLAQGRRVIGVAELVDRVTGGEPVDAWRADYEDVVPDPEHFFAVLERLQPVVHGWPGWTDGEIRSVTAPTLLVVGDQDFVRLDHAAEMLDLFPDCRLAVLPGTKHAEVMQRSEQPRALVGPVLS